MEEEIWGSQAPVKICIVNSSQNISDNEMVKNRKTIEIKLCPMQWYHH